MDGRKRELIGHLRAEPGLLWVYNLAQPFMLAEVAIMLWLAIMGAKEQRLAAAES